MRDENVGTGTSALREGQVRIRIVQPHKRWSRRRGLTLILISPHTLLHHHFVLIRRRHILLLFICLLQMEYIGHWNRHIVHSGYHVGRIGIENHTHQSDHHPSDESHEDR